MNLQKVFAKAEAILQNTPFLKMVNEGKLVSEWREGFYLCILSERASDGEDSPPLALVMIGNIPKEKRARYYKNAQEKAFRLRNSPITDLSSWATRNPEEGQYGGAVRASGYIIAPSGFPEEWDEVLGCLLGRTCFDMHESTAEKIGNLSGSKELHQCLAARMGAPLLEAIS